MRLRRKTTPVGADYSDPKSASQAAAPVKKPKAKKVAGNDADGEAWEWTSKIRSHGINLYFKKILPP